MKHECPKCKEPVPDWLLKVSQHLEGFAGRELRPRDLAQAIHEALEIAEASKYATEESCFTFCVQGISERQLAEVRRLLTPFENRIFKLDRVTDET